MKKLQTAGILNYTSQESFDDCESCLSAKLTKAPFTGIGQRAKDLLGFVHTDVCGPFRTMSRSGERYFVTFTDAFSRYEYVYLMKHKHETFEMFKQYLNEVQNRLGNMIKMLRSDRGEYLSQEFDKHLKKCRIISQLTPPGIPQLNGVSERRNRTLLDMVRSMMCRINLLHSFWSFSLETTTRIINLAPINKVDKTPYEIWHREKPKVSYLRVWGFNTYVTSESTDKLNPRGDKVVFVGYPKTNGYYFYNPAENRVFIKRIATLLEKELLTRGIGDNRVDMDEIQEPQTESSVQHVSAETESRNVQDSTVTQAVHRSARDRHEPDRYIGIHQIDDILIVDQAEPTSYKSAILDSESKKWLEAMDAEIQSMYDNHVWDLVDLHPKSQTVGSNWIFKKKIEMDGNVETFKARLVVKGFTQTQGIDYDETFSPVAMLKSISILLAIAVYYDYKIWQMDVKTAFLNGHLTGDVYMVQPKGFEDPKNPNKVYKLNKSIYGLKHASRSWNIRFDQKIKEFGFVKNKDKLCVYKKASGSHVTFLILKCFTMKDLGEVAYILGIKIYRDRSKRLIDLSQSTYIDKAVQCFFMHNSKRGSLPMAHGTILNNKQCPQSDEDKKKMERVPYASAIGSIIESHWIAVKNILKYLRRTKDMFLIYGGLEEELAVKCYTDASFRTDQDDSRSQTGFIFVLNGGAITWKSIKQSVVAQSTTEFEYIASSKATKEAAWMKKVIADLGVMPSIQKPIEILCDNTGVIAQAKEPRSHHITKHILRRFHYIRDILEQGGIVLNKVHTDQNLADLFT
ncbi:hypothetical protein L1987_13373 [Smallanthus sonchifolius]|uniref:Uncharacterized protein n=1 Tax=Smallanthus sonchifolius TaxID=185202 RepID=A0ACB9JGQ6_9ASTR|nr:hypothetical protein L1987_13373 [Smallanthus sonchifolius]